MHETARQSATFRLTSLEPPELESEYPAIKDGGDPYHTQGLAERFRHSGWQRNRTLVYDALRRTMQSCSRLIAFDACGVSAYVYRSKDEPHDYRLGGSSCRDRFCVPCARDRSRCLASNVLKASDGGPSRFLTLTLKQSADPLAHTIDRIYSSFARLRQSKVWRRHVNGGCAFLEMKWAAHSKMWNVHLHCVVHGSYLPQAKLSATWHRITGDSPIVDVRFVKDDERVAAYVTKYVSKPLNSTFLNRPARLDEVIVATRNRRLCLTFGTWRGIKLTESPNDREWVSIGAFHDVALRAVDGDAESLKAVRQICRENTDTVLDVVVRARPPPEQTPNDPSQMTFAWPAVDARF